MDIYGSTEIRETSAVIFKNMAYFLCGKVPIYLPVLGQGLSVNCRMVPV